MRTTAKSIKGLLRRLVSQPKCSAANLILCPSMSLAEVHTHALILSETRLNIELPLSGTLPIADQSCRAAGADNTLGLVLCGERAVPLTRVTSPKWGSSEGKRLDTIRIVCK